MRDGSGAIAVPHELKPSNIAARRLLHVAFLVAIFLGTPFVVAAGLDIQGGAGAGAYTLDCRQPPSFWVLFERCDGEDGDVFTHAFLTAAAGALAMVAASFERIRGAKSTVWRVASLVVIGVGGAAALLGLIGLASLLEPWVAAVTFGGAMLAALGGLGLSRYRDTSLLPALSIFVLFFSGVLMWSLFWDLPA